MAIVKPAGPARGAELVGQAMAHLTGGSSSIHTLTFAGDLATSRTSQPLRVFSLGLGDITDQNFLAKATPVGWRYLVVRGEPVALADLKHTSPAGDQLAFSRLTHGVLAQRLAQAAQLADDTYRQSPETFEVRILEIPALYVGALWLHGQRDVLIPFVQRTDEDSGPPREDAEFVQRILREAREKPRSGDPAAAP